MRGILDADRRSQGRREQAGGRQDDGRVLRAAGRHRQGHARRRALDELRREPRLLPQPEQPDELRAHLQHRVPALQGDPRRSTTKIAVRPDHGLLGDQEARHRAEVRRARRTSTSSSSRRRRGRRRSTSRARCSPRRSRSASSRTRTTSTRRCRPRPAAATCSTIRNVDHTIEEIAKLAGQFGAARIQISGHTDASMRASPTRASCASCRCSRANAVKQELVNKFKMNPNQFVVAGYGWDKPADPKDPDNHAKNRRVEIKVVPGGGAVSGRGSKQHANAPAAPAPQLPSRAAVVEAAARRSAVPDAASRSAPALIASSCFVWWFVTHGRGRRAHHLAVEAAVARRGVRLDRHAGRARARRRHHRRRCSACFLGVVPRRARRRRARRARRRRTAASARRSAPIVIFLRSVPMGALAAAHADAVRDRREAEGDVHLSSRSCRSCSPTRVKAVSIVPERYVETAQTLGASRCQIILKVLVPLALPDIITSLRFQFGLALGYVMLAEDDRRASAASAQLLNGSQREGQREHVLSAAVRHRAARVRHRSRAAHAPARRVPVAAGPVSDDRPSQSPRAGRHRHRPRRRRAGPADDARRAIRRPRPPRSPRSRPSEARARREGSAESARRWRAAETGDRSRRRARSPRRAAAVAPVSGGAGWRRSASRSRSRRSSCSTRSRRATRAASPRSRTSRSRSRTTRAAASSCRSSGRRAAASRR